MPAPTGTGLSIAPCTGRCAATDRELTVGEPIVAVLIEDPETLGLARLDFAAHAWDAGARPDPKLRLYGSWRTRRPEARERERPLIASGDALDLLSQLADSDAPQARLLRYLLALQLLRKRKLELLRVRREDRAEIMEFRVRGSGETLDVEDPKLDDDAVTDAAEQLGRLIGLDTEDTA